MRTPAMKSAFRLEPRGSGSKNPVKQVRIDLIDDCIDIANLFLYLARRLCPDLQQLPNIKG